MDSFNRYTLPANPHMQEVFDEIHNSYDIKMLKTTDNGKYFIEACNKLNIKIQDSILIDDSEDICHVFTSLGGKSYCVTGVEKVKEVLEHL